MRNPFDPFGVFGEPMPNSRTFADLQTAFRPTQKIVAHFPGSPGSTVEVPMLTRTQEALLPSRERLGGADIFIGGGGDDLSWLGLGVMRDYARRYADETGRPTYYFPNMPGRKLQQAIREGNATGGPVNIIGHSWGGPDAYNAAAAAKKAGLRVDNVVTLDPVGGVFGRVEPENGSDSWMNVHASPDYENRDDRITRFPVLAHKPSNLPVGLADEYVDVAAHHGDVDRMMAKSGARRALDRSRSIPADLTDSLPTPEWMRRRNSGRPLPDGW